MPASPDLLSLRKVPSLPKSSSSNVFQFVCLQQQMLNNWFSRTKATISLGSSGAFLRCEYFHYGPHQPANVTSLHTDLGGDAHYWSDFSTHCFPPSVTAAARLGRTPFSDQLCNKPIQAKNYPWRLTSLSESLLENSTSLHRIEVSPTDHFFFRKGTAETFT